MLSTVVWTVDPIAFSLGGLEVRWYGILWATGLALALWIEEKLYKNEHLPTDWTDKLFLYMTIGVIVGARLGHCFFYEWHQVGSPEAMYYGLDEPVKFLGLTFNYRNPYIENPFKLLKIWEGGLSSHGGAFGLIFMAWLLSKKHFKTGLVWIFDRLMIGICICGACIRLGNLMNSEIYGNPTDMPWGFQFNGDMDADGNPVFSHPTQIYEILYCLVTFAVCWWLYWRKKAYEFNGLIFGVSLIGIFFTRFMLEFIKLDQEAFEANHLLNMGQILSIPFVVWGVWLIIKALKHGREVPPRAEPLAKAYIKQHPETDPSKEKKN